MFSYNIHCYRDLSESVSLGIILHYCTLEQINSYTYILVRCTPSTCYSDHIYSPRGLQLHAPKTYESASYNISAKRYRMTSITTCMYRASHMLIFISAVYIIHYILYRVNDIVLCASVAFLYYKVILYVHSVQYRLYSICILIFDLREITIYEIFKLCS